MKDNNDNSIQIISANTTIKYIQKQLFSIKHNDDIRSKISIVHSNSYDLSSSNTLSHHKSITFLFCLNDTSRLSQVIYNENAMKDNPYIKDIHPQHPLLDYNQLQSCHLLYDLENKSMFYLYATSKLLFIQSITDNNPEVLFEITLFDSYAIKGVYTFNGVIDVIFVLLNNNTLIELNYRQTPGNQTKLLQNLLKHKKSGGCINGKSITLITCQYILMNQMQCEYYVCLFNKTETNMISLMQFSEEERIGHVEIYYTATLKLVAFEMNKGILRVIDYKIYKIIGEYKVSYGRVTSIAFSYDGNLLGVGSEDGNCYVIDIQAKVVLACLEGHKNYVTSIIFEKKETSQENENNKDSKKSNVNNKNNDNEWMKSNSKFTQMTCKDFLLLWGASNDNNQTQSPISNSSKTISKRKERHSFHPNMRNRVIEPPPEKREYDIYTSGLDGYISSWHLEYQTTNIIPTDEDDQSSIPTARDIESIKAELINNPSQKKIFQYFPPIPLPSSSSSSLFLQSTLFLKASKHPIIKFTKINSVIVLMTIASYDSSYGGISFYIQEKTHNIRHCSYAHGEVSSINKKNN